MSVGKGLFARQVHAMNTTTLNDVKPDQTTTLRTFWQRKLKLQRLVMFITSIAFTLLVFVQVVSRYLFDYSFFGIEEAASYLAVTMYFIGAAYGTQANGHISASIVDTLCRPGPFVDLAHILTRLISALLCGFLCWEIYQLVMFNAEMDTRSVELRLPMVWVYGGMLIGMALMTFYFLVEMVEAFNHLIRPHSTQDPSK